MNTLHIKKGDTVVVLSGTEKGKSGKVLQVFPKTGLAIVEGLNMHTKHQRPRRAGQAGQIIQKQSPLRVSKLMEAGKHKARKSKKGKK